MRISMDSCGRSVVRLATAMPLPVPTRKMNRFPLGTITTTRRGGGGAVTVVDGDEEEEGVVVILGTTATGKSKLSIDIGTRFPAEVVNSDKMQVYRGFDITTNKMTVAERSGVPHHLLGELDPLDGELSPLGFRSVTSKRIAAIRSRKKLPVVAGGSNSYVHALLAKRYDHPSINSVLPISPINNSIDVSIWNMYDEKVDVFKRENWREEDDGNGLNYRCSLLWVDVSWEVLALQLDRRVEEMVKMGMIDELAVNFDRNRAEEGVYTGVDMAIGVPEFDRFFLKYSPEEWLYRGSNGGDRRMKEEYESAVEKIKVNTRVLARRQVEKIERLRVGMGWEMRRLDSTEAVKRRLEGCGKEEVEEAWERDVLLPALADIGGFVEGCRCGDRRNWM